MREVAKTVKHEVEGEEVVFQIRKMNALDGTYMLKFVAEKLLPLVGGFQSIFEKPSEGEDGEESAEDVAEKRTDMLMEMIPKALATISKEELIDFEKQCLRLVDMMKPAGWQPVMMGEFSGYMTDMFSSVSIKASCICLPEAIDAETQLSISLNCTLSSCMRFLTMYSS